ncbi:hypothetical protein GDO86_012237 [Hymenochirus boettgeri]|uniref:GB1/RHD3-type G domain-containing protein n=1 Tax=Hymenochirus boettgeri TaxID=247094 RepID=A0A8T2IP89_9PIPI|nr:hypothetical protein GDO86_012237 [Hymenochirus boettgeri]
MDESGEFKRFFPSLIGAFGDFILKLEMGWEIHHGDEYLKNSLELKKGTGKKVQDYNLPRECIRHYFQALKCFVFDRPAPKDGLRHLDDLQDSELEPEFVKQANNFCSYVYENCKVKSLTNGITVTGRILGNLTVTYLEAILSGTIPCMENAVTALAQIENSQAVEEALIKYDDEMCKYIAQFPTETQEEFLNFHQMCESQAIPVFMNRSFKDEKQEYQGKLIIELAERKANYSKQNEDESIRCCKAIRNS